MEPFAHHLNILHLPFRLIGMEIGKNVSLIQLKSGDLIIHSSAPFNEGVISEIREWGNPRWILEATNFHDTFATAGIRAFPEARFLAPEGFPKAKSLDALDLDTPPPEWNEEVEVSKIEGMPKINEYAFLHRPSKTLIVADLFFNIPDSAGAYTKGGLRLLSGIKSHPGTSRLLTLSIKDAGAFARSIRQISQLDFDKIIVGHGQPILSAAKDTLIDIFEAKGFSIRSNS